MDSPNPRGPAGSTDAEVALLEADLVDLAAGERTSLRVATSISVASSPLLIVLFLLAMLDSPWRVMFGGSIVGWIGLLGLAWHRYIDARTRRLRHARALESIRSEHAANARLQSRE